VQGKTIKKKEREVKWKAICDYDNRVRIFMRLPAHRIILSMFMGLDYIDIYYTWNGDMTIFL